MVNSTSLHNDDDADYTKDADDEEDEAGNL